MYECGVKHQAARLQESAINWQQAVIRRLVIGVAALSNQSSFSALKT